MHVDRSDDGLHRVIQRTSRAGRLPAIESAVGANAAIPWRGVAAPNRSLSRSRTSERAVLLCCVLPLCFHEHIAIEEWPAGVAGQCIDLVAFCSGCGGIVFCDTPPFPVIVRHSPEKPCGTAITH
jgi:hypothetical protein